MIAFQVKSPLLTRRERAAALVAVLLAASLVGVVVSQAQGTSRSSSRLTPAAANCAAADLGTLGGSQGNAIAASSNGLVTGYAEDAAGRPQPVLWKGSQVSRISTGLVNVTPVGVNSHGEVVGTGVKPTSLEEVGWHWVAGRTSFLRTTAGRVAVPTAISDTGRIVGALASSDDGGAEPTAGEAPEQAVTWASSSSPARVLPALPGDVGARIYGLNTNGVMVGSSQGPDHFTPAIWDAGGHVSALPGLGGSWGVARAVDDAGIVVGAAVAASGDQQAMMWDVGHHATKLGTTGGRAVQVTGLADGAAFGQSEVRDAGDVVHTQALRWDAGGNAAVLPPLPGHSGAGVNAASADGLVVGFSSDDRGSRRPTTWTCSP